MEDDPDKVMGLYEEGSDPHRSGPNILLGPPDEEGASSAPPDP
jgi:hypothetical protein